MIRSFVSSSKNLSNNDIAELARTTNYEEIVLSFFTEVQGGAIGRTTIFFHFLGCPMCRVISHLEQF